MTNTKDRFNDFIDGFDKNVHFLYAKDNLVSADIAETIFLYGVKGTEFKIVNIEDRKTVKQTTN